MNAFTILDARSAQLTMAGDKTEFKTLIKLRHPRGGDAAKPFKGKYGPGKEGATWEKIDPASVEYLGWSDQPSVDGTFIIDIDDFYACFQGYTVNYDVSGYGLKYYLV